MPDPREQSFIQGERSLPLRGLKPATADVTKVVRSGFFHYPLFFFFLFLRPAAMDTAPLSILDNCREPLRFNTYVTFYLVCPTEWYSMDHGAADSVFLNPLHMLIFPSRPRPYCNLRLSTITTPYRRDPEIALAQNTKHKMHVSESWSCT